LARLKTVLDLRKYLERIADPAAEHHPDRRTFWSRQVRDNARALADAIIMDQEGVPRDLIAILTTSADRSSGIDLDQIDEIFEDSDA